MKTPASLSPQMFLQAQQQIFDELPWSIRPIDPKRRAWATKILVGILVLITVLILAIGATICFLLTSKNYSFLANVGLITTVTLGGIIGLFFLKNQALKKIKHIEKWLLKFHYHFNGHDKGLEYDFLQRAWAASAMLHPQTYKHIQYWLIEYETFGFYEINLMLSCLEQDIALIDQLHQHLQHETLTTQEKQNTQKLYDQARKPYTDRLNPTQIQQAWLQCQEEAKTHHNRVNLDQNTALASSPNSSLRRL